MFPTHNEITDVFGGNEAKIITMLDAIKVWADNNYPMNKYGTRNDTPTSSSTKKSDTSVVIGKDSGWRASAMMDHRHAVTDKGY